MRAARIANARIVTPEGVVEGDIAYELPEEGGTGAVACGRILEVGEVSGSFAETHDARGAWAVPGGIDPHVHFRGFGDIPIADGFWAGSRAALAGGTTTVIDFVEPEGQESAEHALARRTRDAGESAVDFAFHFVLTEAYERLLADLPLIEERCGIRDFKLFTIYEGETLGEADLAAIFSRLAGDERRTFLVHAEDPVEIGRLRAARGDTPDFLDLARTRPPASEERMARLLRGLAGATGARVCMAHSTCAGTAALLEEPAPERGEFTLETCPHYLAFTEDALAGENGCLYTMTPPLRSSEHVDALWRSVLAGRLGILSTDHCPYAARYKRGTTYQTVPCGVDGVGTRMAWAYSEAVLGRGMDMRDFVRLTSESAARFYGLYPRKGALAPGADADIVLIANEPQVVRATDAFDDIDCSIWEGMRLSGRVSLTVKGGRAVFDGERVRAMPGSGRQLDKTKMGD